MKKKLLVLLFSLTTLALVSCGGGNDVASSGTTAVSAAATDSSSTSAPSTTTATTEPKVNSQIDERTGVAPVVAQLTVWTVYSNGGCGNSVSVNLFANGPSITNAQVRACITAAGYAQTLAQCNALGGSCYYGRAFNIQDGISCRTADGWGLFYPTANGGCANSSSFGYSGPALTVAQQAACNFAIYGSAPGIGVYTGANLNQCNSLGAVMNLYQNSCASSGQIPACFIPYQVNGSIINAC